MSHPYLWVIGTFFTCSFCFALGMLLSAAFSNSKLSDAECRAAQAETERDRHKRCAETWRERCRRQAAA